MFCANCGNQIADGAKFCASCGAATEAAPQNEAPAQQAAPQQFTPTQQYAPAQQSAPKASSDKKIGMIAAGIVAVIVVILAVLIFGGRGPKATANKFLKATFNGNAKQVVSVMPKKLVKAMIEDDYHGDKKDMLEDLDDSLDEMLDYFDEMDLKYKFKITDIDKLDKDETEEYEEDLNSGYDTNIKIKKTKVVTVEMTVKSKELDQKEKTEFDIIVGKIGSSWYVVYSDLI